MKNNGAAQIRRDWNIPPNTWLRYSGIRGAYWYWLSRSVRKFEWEKWGVCLTCQEPMASWEEGDCGHIIASSGCGEFLRFNRRNLCLQHKSCNNPRFTPNASALNAINYDKRYGLGAWEKLYADRKQEAKEPTTKEYIDLIKVLDTYDGTKR